MKVNIGRSKSHETIDFVAFFVPRLCTFFIGIRRHGNRIWSEKTQHLLPLRLSPTIQIQSHLPPCFRRKSSCRQRYEHTAWIGGSTSRTIPAACQSACSNSPHCPTNTPVINAKTQSLRFIQCYGFVVHATSILVMQTYYMLLKALLLPILPLIHGPHHRPPYIPMKALVIDAV